MIHDPIEEELKNKQFVEGKLAIIVNTNEKKDEINLSKLRSLLPQEKEYICLANDKMTQKKGYVGLNEDISHLVKTKKMVKKLVIRRYAPVVLTVNHTKKEFKEDGLVNGAKGYIDYIKTSEDDPTKVKVIWVDFRDQRIGAKCYRRRTMHKRPKDVHIDFKALPIFPTSKELEVLDGNMHFVRSQFSLTLAYAITAHKSQGDTVEKCIVDFDDRYNVFGMFYVAITRIKSKLNLYLRRFKETFIQCYDKLKYELETMVQTKQYMMKKLYCNEPVFKSEDLRVGYLNINGLVMAGHYQYINTDHNLLCLDILALGETHLSSEDSNEDLQMRLQNWKVLSHLRLDSMEKKKNMGLIVLASKQSQYFKHLNLDDEEQVKNLISKLGSFQERNRDGISCQIGDHRFTFIYSNHSLSLNEAASLHSRTADMDYLLGDLNLNPKYSNELKALYMICGTSMEMLLNETTTKHNSQIDHITGRKRENRKIFITTFFNFATDHRTIVLRIGSPGSDYLQDPRISALSLSSYGTHPQKLIGEANVDKQGILMYKTASEKVSASGTGQSKKSEKTKAKEQKYLFKEKANSSYLK